MVLAVMGGRTAAAQDSSAPALELGTDLQAPGNIALISLTLRVPEGVTVGKTLGEVSYPSKLVAFEEVQRGLSAEAAGAEVTAATAAGADTSIVRVTVATKPGGQIPSGAIAELHFKVLEPAAKEKTVPLKLKASAWSDKTPPAPIEPVKASDGQIEITATAPLPACFFYMH
jgi:hypothetical protein